MWTRAVSLGAAEEHEHKGSQTLLRSRSSEASPEAATIEIVWKGGTRQSVTVLRPRGVDAAVKARTLEGDSSTAIAERLNAAGVVTASGRPVSPNVIHGDDRAQQSLTVVMRPARRAPELADVPPASRFSNFFGS